MAGDNRQRGHVGRSGVDLHGLFICLLAGHGANGRAQFAAVDTHRFRHDVYYVSSDDGGDDVAVGYADDMAVCQG